MFLTSDVAPGNAGAAKSWISSGRCKGLAVVAIATTKLLYKSSLQQAW